MDNNTNPLKPKPSRLSKTLTAIVGAAFLFAHVASANVVIQHEGEYDPASMDWMSNRLANPETSVEPIPEEGAWQTSDKSKQPGDILYWYDTEHLYDAASKGWRLTATLNVLEASSHSVLLLSYTDHEGRRYMITFDRAGKDGAVRVGPWNDAPRMVDTGISGNLTVNLVFDGKAASLYLGDSTTPVVTVYTGTDTQSGWKNAVRWGTAHGGGTAVANWQRVAFIINP